jgi:hypothetical protein
MTMHLKLIKHIYMVTCSLMLLCWYPPVIAQEIETKKENGITVVTNPSVPVPLEGYSTRAVLREDLIIGEESDKEDHWFSYLNYLAVDAAGNIYTLDPKDIRIRVFDPQGKLLRAFGRNGQGPGEFQGPGYIVITPKGKLFVSDVLNQRLTYMTLEGELDKVISLSTLPRGAFKPDSRGFLYRHTVQGTGGKTQQELVRHGPDLESLLKLHSFEEKRERGVFQPYPKVYIYDVTQDDHFVWLLTTAYDIRVVDPTGNTIRRIKKDHKDIKITKADKDRYMKTRSQSFLDRFRIEFPDHYPVCSRQRVDEKNRIFIRTYARDDKSDHIVDVFDPQGRYFSRFAVPQDERIYAIKNGKVYCITENKEGIPVVKRYTIEW